MASDVRSHPLAIDDVRGQPTILAGPPTLRELAGRLTNATLGNLSRCRNRLTDGHELRPCIGCHCGAIKMAAEAEQLRRLATVLDSVRLAARDDAPASALVESLGELILGMQAMEPERELEIRTERRLELA